MIIENTRSLKMGEFMPQKVFIMSVFPYFRKRQRSLTGSGFSGEAGPNKVVMLFTCMEKNWAVPL